MSDFKAIVAEMKKSAEEVRSKIKALNVEIEELERERSAINAAPVSKEDFMTYIREDIRRKASRMPELIEHKWRDDSDLKNYERLEKIHARGGAQGFPYINGETNVDHVTLGSSPFFWYFGDLIAERFEQLVDRLEWPESAMPVLMRRERIDEINSKIRDLTSQRNLLEFDLRSVVI